MVSASTSALTLPILSERTSTTKDPASIPTMYSDPNTCFRYESAHTKPKSTLADVRTGPPASTTRSAAEHVDLSASPDLTADRRASQEASGEEGTR